MDLLNVIMPIIDSEKGWSRASLNYILSVSTIIGIITPFIFGSIFMKFGLRKTNIVVVIVVSAATAGMGLATSIGMFAFSMGVVQVVTMAIVTSVPALMSNWFVKKRGRVLGIVTIAAPTSTALFTPAATALIKGVGYSTAFVIFAVAFLVLGVGLSLLVPETPEEVGLFTDGDAVQSNVVENGQEENKGKLSVKGLLSMKETWFIIIGFGAVYLMMTGIMSQLIARFTDQGIPIGTALMILSIAAIIGMPFSYFWGWLDDKISTPKTSFFFILTYVIASIAMIFASSNNMLAAGVAGLCVAATTGGMPNLIPSIVAWVYGRDEFLNVYRIIAVFHGIFRSAAFTMMGVIFAKNGSYTLAYYIFIPVAIIGAVSMLGVKRSYDPLNSAYQPVAKKGTVNKAM
jgi:sugar phosphate permease